MFVSISESLSNLTCLESKLVMTVLMKVKIFLLLSLMLPLQIDAKSSRNSRKAALDKILSYIPDVNLNACCRYRSVCVNELSNSRNLCIKYILAEN